MICYVTPEARTRAIRHFLAADGQPLAQQLRIVTWEELARARSIPRATWVFAAVDQLCPAERELADLLAARVEEAWPDVRILNRPSEVLRRYELLRAALDAGINPFRAVPASAVLPGRAERPGGADERIADELRYPVFVRERDDHSGALAGLIDGRAALERALVSLMLRGYVLEELLVVEFCDTADAAGIYRKYSAFIVGDVILPRYLNASREWMVKQGGRIYEARFADEELAYLASNPHEPWLRAAFGLARIRYGRIDYGVQNGAPRIWEINTSPTIGRVGPPRPRPPEAERYRDWIAPGRERFYRDFIAAWRAVDEPGTGQIEFAAPVELLRRLEREKATRRRALARADRARRLARSALARAVKRSIEPAAHRLAPLLLRFVRARGQP